MGGGERILFLDFFDTGISNWLWRSPICLGYLINISWRFLFPCPPPAPQNTVLSSPDWSQVFSWASDHPVSAFWELGLEPCATVPSFPKDWTCSFLLAQNFTNQPTSQPCSLSSCMVHLGALLLGASAFPIVVSSWWAGNTPYCLVLIYPPN